MMPENMRCHIFACFFVCSFVFAFCVCRPEQAGLSEARELEAMSAQAKGLVGMATASRQRRRQPL